MAALVQSVRGVLRRDVVARVTTHLQMFSTWGEMTKVVDDEIQRAKQGGGAMAIDRHINKNGKMLVRDRLNLLLDPGTSLLELSPLAGYKMYGKDGIAAAGMIVRRISFVRVHFILSLEQAAISLFVQTQTGIGIVSGMQCMVVANDATVKGGALYPLSSYI